MEDGGSVRKEEVKRSRVRKLLAMKELFVAVVTEKPKWAAIYMSENAVEQSGITTTPEILEGFQASLGGFGVLLPDHVNNMIKVLAAGNYGVFTQFSAKGDANKLFEIHVNVNGVESPFGGHRKFGTTGDEGSASMIAPLIGLSVDDEVALYINVGTTTGNYTPVDVQFFMIQIR